MIIVSDLSSSYKLLIVNYSVKLSFLVWGHLTYPFFLSGYGDKEVSAKLNPELEKRLPREYTEWRRYSQGFH